MHVELLQRVRLLLQLLQHLGHQDGYVKDPLILQEQSRHVERFKYLNIEPFPQNEENR